MKYNKGNMENIAQTKSVQKETQNIPSTNIYVYFIHKTKITWCHPISCLPRTVLLESATPHKTGRIVEESKTNQL
jgi:hypothetical protein